MSRSNKSAREMLEKIYGKHCFICQGIRKLNPPKPKKAHYKSVSIAKQLTYHHLKPKRLEGKATIENGAELCRSCHDWLEQLSKKEKEIINNELRQYKASFKIVVAELTTEGIKHVTEYTPEIEEPIYIPAYDFTEEEYQEFLQRKRKAELEKPRWKGEEK